MTGFWNTVIGKWIGGVLAVATVGLVVGTVTHMFEFWEVQASVIKIEASIEKGEETAAKNQETIIKALTALKGQMEQVITKQEYFEDLLVTPEVGGRATIGTFGRDSSYVEINEDGKAAIYLSADHISLTYKDQDGISHTVVLDVRGSFVNREDSGHLIMLSAKAGRDLGMNGITKQIIVGPGDADHTHD